MFLDWELLTVKLQNVEEICLLVSKEYSSMVQDVYDKIISLSPNINIFIISSDEIICPLKHKKMDMVVLMGIECPEHKFHNRICITEELIDEQKNKLKNEKNIIFDSSFLKYQQEDFKIDEEVLIVTKNESFLRYYSRIADVKSFFNLEMENKMEFLTRRINLSEIAKNNKTFAIIFVHEIYKDLAVKIKEVLEKTGRCAYLLFLRNVRYSRLITIEKIDTLVLIDCPSFDNYQIDVTLPILSPIDVQYILTKKWDSQYEINKFEVEHENTKDKEICKFEGAGKLILESEFFGFQFSHNEEEEDLEIHEGRRGIAGSYENENKH
ncbi:2-(3-amino-3-carboxypropyl)histidine synthase subunit [Vairimorpha necatrix]|uniref:2-(3-amino-3-carboxypropyl)histidine synthase subunit n=1 Tax=Vairimorpha necatrix TaxID=6039 RepID=A0AAX4J9I6_9MICR